MEQGARVAPAKASPKKSASPKKPAPKAKKGAKGAKAAKSPRAGAKKGAADARNNKRAEVIAMMKRAEGVTLAEIVEATDCQDEAARKWEEFQNRPAVGAPPPKGQVQ